ncbi:MAG TPA: response regulator [Terriglobales bacterium]|nr:response regulator [Terriglobales bacterium]
MATLLCIDDELSILELRKLLLQQQGYDVRTAESGEKGLELFRREAVDAVLLDYFMPGMKGDEVAREIRRLSPDTPIILVTGFLSLEQSQVCDVDAFVTKGQSPEVLLTTLRNLLPGTLTAAA